MTLLNDSPGYQSGPSHTLTVIRSLVSVTLSLATQPVFPYSYYYVYVSPPCLSIVTLLLPLIMTHTGGREAGLDDGLWGVCEGNIADCEVMH